MELSYITSQPVWRDQIIWYRYFYYHILGENVKDKSSKCEKNTLYAPILFHFKLRVESDALNSNLLIYW